MKIQLHTGEEVVAHSSHIKIIDSQGNRWSVRELNGVLHIHASSDLGSAIRIQPRASNAIELSTH